MSSPVSSSSQPLVLVTGASGLIGRPVCRDLARDHTVVGLDVSPPKGPAPEMWVECDLTSDTSVDAAFETIERRAGRRVASVIHLAAYYDFSGEPSPLYEELTVAGTRRVLRALRRFDVEQFVFSSSLLVMRPVEPGGAIDEDSPLEATWDYPRSKLDAERVVGEERGDASAVILRIAGVYDEDGHSPPITQQMARIHGRVLESYFFPGNAHNGQSFVHLSDLTRCIRAVVERRRELGKFEKFLIGEPDVMSYAEMQDVIGEAIHGRDWPTIRIPKPLAKAGAWLKDKAARDDGAFIKPWMIDIADAHRPISIARAERLLGWRPERRLRDVLPEMARRLLRDPRAWYAENHIEMPRRAEASA